MVPTNAFHECMQKHAGFRLWDLCKEMVCAFPGRSLSKRRIIWRITSHFICTNAIWSIRGYTFWIENTGCTENKNSYKKQWHSGIVQAISGRKPIRILIFILLLSVKICLLH